MPSRPASLPRRHRQIFSRGTTSTSQPRSSRRARRRSRRTAVRLGHAFRRRPRRRRLCCRTSLDSRRLRGGARERVPRLRSESGQLHARGVVVGPGRRDRDRRRSPPRVAASGRSAEAVSDRVERARRPRHAPRRDRRRHGRRRRSAAADWCSTRRSITSGRAISICSLRRPINAARRRVRARHGSDVHDRSDVVESGAADRRKSRSGAAPDGRAGVLELFAGYERRIDADPLDFQPHNWALAGFRLLAR